MSSSAFDDGKLLPFLATAREKPAEALRVSLVVSASPQKASGPNAIKTMAFLREHGVIHSQFVDLDEEPYALGTLEASDVVILNGGNPFLLLGALRRNGCVEGLDSLARSERVVVGVSAGGMVFSPGLHVVEDLNRLLGFTEKGNVDGLDDVTGFNHFDEMFLPHWDVFSERDPGLSEKVAELERERKVKFYRQPNGRTALVTNRKIEEL